MFVSESKSGVRATFLAALMNFVPVRAIGAAAISAPNMLDWVLEIDQFDGR